MSTVIRPVGPHPPGVYWLRRLVPLVVLVVIILILAKACSGGSPSKGAGTRPGAALTPSVSISPSNSASPPSACQTSDLTLTLQTDSETYSLGQAPTVSGVISNPTTSTCTFTRDPKKEFWTVTSGPATIWTTKGCPASTNPAKTIRIKAGATKMLRTIWNGNQFTDCTDTGTQALAGTYHLSATLDGVKGAETTFHITSSTTG